MKSRKFWTLVVACLLATAVGAAIGARFWSFGQHSLKPSMTHEAEAGNSRAGLSSVPGVKDPKPTSESLYDANVGQEPVAFCPTLPVSRVAQIRDYVERIASHFAGIDKEDLRRRGTVSIDSESMLSVENVADSELNLTYTAFLLSIGASSTLQIDARNAAGERMSLGYSPPGTLTSFSGMVPGEKAEVSFTHPNSHTTCVALKYGECPSQWEEWDRYGEQGKSLFSILQSACAKAEGCEEDKPNFDVPEERRKWFTCTESRLARDAALTDSDISERMSIVRKYVGQGAGDMDAFRALVARNSAEAVRNGLKPLDIKQDLLRLALPGEPLAAFKEMVVSKLFELYGKTLSDEELGEFKHAWEEEARITEFVSKYKDRSHRAASEAPQDRPVPKEGESRAKAPDESTTLRIRR